MNRPAQFSPLFGDADTHPLEALRDLCDDAGLTTRMNEETAPVRVLKLLAGTSAGGLEPWMDCIFLDEAAALIGPQTASRLTFLRMRCVLPVEFSSAAEAEISQLASLINVRLAPGFFSTFSTGDSGAVFFQDCHVSLKSRFRPDIAFELIERHCDTILRCSDIFAAVASGKADRETASTELDRIFGPCPPSAESLTVPEPETQA